MSPTVTIRSTRRFSRRHFRVRTPRESCHHRSPPITGHRFYNPDSGRWLNRDPSEERGGLNLCAFVFNNPMGAIDPDGQVPWLFVAGLTKATYHFVLACYYCAKANQCKNAAQDAINRAAAQFSDLQDLMDWLRTAKPGTECGPLAAQCAQQSLQFTVWLMGSVVLKYGVKITVIK
ncbi:MAG: RHS repeat-associated core domain-containing protein [Limisphaerales bacterium]